MSKCIAKVGLISKQTQVSGGPNVGGSLIIYVYFPQQVTATQLYYNS